MTSDQSPPPAGGLEEPAPENHQTIADEQFVHGLLGFLHKDDDAAQRRRVARVMRAVSDGDESAASIAGGTSAPPSRAPAPHRWPLIAVATAAAAVLLVAIVFFDIPTDQSALELVQAAITALREPADRRYAVSIERHGEQGLLPAAVLDVRDADHALLRLDTHEGRRLVAGRNADGSWALRPDRSVEHFDAERAWPRWINLGEHTVLLEPIDGLLESLDDRYDVQRADAEPLPSGGRERYERIDATLREAPPRPDGHGRPPQSMTIWLDAETRDVERMEMRWAPRHGGPQIDNPPPYRDHPPGARPPAPQAPPAGRPRDPNGPLHAPPVAAPQPAGPASPPRAPAPGPPVASTPPARPLGSAAPRPRPPASSANRLGSMTAAIRGRRDGL